MKNLILSTIFVVTTFLSQSQIIRIVNVYEVATFSKDTLTKSVFDVLRDPDYIGDTIEVSKRFIINFSDSTFIEYIDGDKIMEGKIDIVSELLPVSDQFCVILIDLNNNVRNLRHYLNMGLYLEQRDNTTYVEYFESFSIY